MYFNREFPYIFGYCFSCRYLVELGLRQLGLPVPNRKVFSVAVLHEIFAPVLGGRFGAFLFFLLGEGEGGVRGSVPGGVGDRFLLKIQGGGGPPGREGPRGREGVCGELGFFFWGGAEYFVSYDAPAPAKGAIRDIRAHASHRRDTYVKALTTWIFSILLQAARFPTLVLQDLF